MPKSWLDRIELGLIFVLSGFVFWPNAISSIGLILLLIIRIMSVRKTAFPNLKDLWLLTPIAVLIVAWIFHGFATDGQRELQLWLTWIAAFIYFKSSPFKAQFSKSFVLLSFIQALVVLIYFTFAEPMSGLGFSHQFREVISSTFHVHPTFLSTAWIWASFICFTQLILSLRNKVLMGSTLIFMAFMAGGRMPLIAAFIVLLIYILFQRNSTKAKIITASSALVLVLLNVFFNPVFSERMNELNALDTSYEEGQMLSSTELRLGIWKCSISSIEENWLFGVGPGNTRHLLDNCYASYEQVEFFQTEFNTHNQYMHFWLSSGILGFTALIGVFLFVLIFAWKHQNVPLLYFTIFFGIICLTENYFSRQFGMMFGAFFFSSYFYSARQVK